MAQDSALDPTLGGACTGSMMVTRGRILGVVCLCPKVKLCWEPSPYGTQIADSVFPKSNLASDLELDYLLLLWT